ncbi:hypothetical protein [Pseudomonas purpurea]|uniref:dTMP kinase n=1 Tax=Pseudomonas purpurea TaxID=3136737 RepID=UPI003267268A
MASLPNSQSGYLIIIEGGDGLGKSTQFEILKRRLESQGRHIVTFDFPNKSGTPIGKLIGNFLRGNFGQVTPEFLGLAFAADRLVARQSIRDALDNGSVVICDRFVASNIAFQGAKIEDDQRRKELDELLRWLEYDVYDLPRPNLEIVLSSDDDYYRDGHHLNRAEDPNRAYAEGEADIHEASLDLQQAVNRYFRELPDDPAVAKIAIKDSSGRRRTVDEMAAIVWDAVNVAMR